MTRILFSLWQLAALVLIGLGAGLQFGPGYGMLAAGVAIPLLLQQAVQVT